MSLRVAVTADGGVNALAPEQTLATDPETVHATPSDDGNRGDEDGDDSASKCELPRRSVVGSRPTIAVRKSIAESTTPTTPALDLEQLSRDRTHSAIRRVSTKSRKLDDASDSMRLESTRRRSSITKMEPSRATVVYSPRALAGLLTKRKTSRQHEPTKRCSVM